MAKCSLCNTRKGKRNCPGLIGVICSQCCGAEREKTIKCPEDCFYLGRAKQYFTERQEAQKISNFDHEMASTIGNEDKHLDVLQNIEFAIYNICKNDFSITDRHVQTALEYLLDMGRAKLDLPAKFLTEPLPKVKSIIDAVDKVIQLRDSMGAREDLVTRLKCVYRVLDSVKTHFDSQEQRSYINFIGQFLR